MAKERAGALGGARRGGLKRQREGAVGLRGGREGEMAAVKWARAGENGILTLGQKMWLGQNDRHRSTSGLLAVGSPSMSHDFRPSGVLTYVGTFNAGKLKNSQT